MKRNERCLQVCEHADVGLLSWLDAEPPVRVPGVRILAPHLREPANTNTNINTAAVRTETSVRQTAAGDDSGRVPLVAGEREMDQLPAADGDLSDDLAGDGRDRTRERYDVVLLRYARETDEDGVHSESFLGTTTFTVRYIVVGRAAGSTCGRKDTTYLDGVHREREGVEVLNRELAPPARCDPRTEVTDLLAHAGLIFRVPG